MYTPSSFKETDPQVIIDFVKAHSFGLFFSQHTETPWATHLPFMLDIQDGELIGLVTHMARANKHWRAIHPSKQVLAAFQGPHTYVTPSWYADRVTVPTWNYASVHIQGTPTVIHDVTELREIVTDLTYHHEQQVSTDWDLKEGEETIDTELKAIVGIYIRITDISAKFKFNQNRSVEDQQGVIDGLEREKGEAAKPVVDIMKKNLQKK